MEVENSINCLISMKVSMLTWSGVCRQSSLPHFILRTQTVVGNNVISKTAQSLLIGFYVFCGTIGTLFYWPIIQISPKHECKSLDFRCGRTAWNQTEPCVLHWERRCRAFPWSLWDGAGSRRAGSPLVRSSQRCDLSSWLPSPGKRRRLYSPAWASQACQRCTKPMLSRPPVAET